MAPVPAGMSGRRRLLLDEGPGERRGVVLLDGEPERLIIRRDGEQPSLIPGQRSQARVRRLERGSRLAFLEVDGQPAVLSMGAVRIDEGQAVEVEVLAPARPGKAATVRLADAATAAPGPSQDLTVQLQALAPDAAIERGAVAGEAAELAEEQALQTVFALGGGASLSIETTRGMTAIDIDLGGVEARAAARINQTAICAAARLLRLKGLGGLVVFDLVGDGRGGDALAGAAREAFAPDMPGVAFGPVSRLGVFHLSLPWRSAPTAGVLLGPDGALSTRTLAQRLAREIEREAAHAVRVVAACAPDVAEAATEVRAHLLARLGPRFEIRPDARLARAVFEVRGQ